MTDSHTPATSTPATAETGAPIVYTTTWCPFCARLTKLLDERGVQYTEVDVEADPAAAEFVEGVNGGDRIVPTVRYSDGTTATNPGASKVQAKLAELAGA